ncbi:MAG: peptidylprolyl isomerase [Gammaproteobacteria bacterium]|nr:peptidylprolyl isomerase [Gammaproteobacteria bacterium]MCP5201174.1 peptidylprolyl isomerase [Gammaproteobacteria bacterium]
MRLIPVIGAVALGALLILVGAFGARWLSPPDADGTVELVQEPAVAPTDSGFHAHIDLAALRELMAVLPAQQRAQILDDADNFSKFVEQETVNQAVLAAAYANGADRNEAIQVLMQRAGQRVLAEAYLNQVVRGNLDPDFPSDAQVREAYDKNPDAFRVPRRMHIWQIFLPFADGADAAARKQTGDLARRLVGELRDGKTTFEAAAKKYSGHQQSRLNDGYMGLIRVDELLPAVADAANALKVDGISDPIETADGLHIIKRGQAIESEMLAFDAVEAQVRERLRREAALKIRQAALEKIAAEFPVDTGAGDAESWREALLEAPLTTAPAAASASANE